jgi:SAM-dependent methyltransferase
MSFDRHAFWKDPAKSGFPEPWVAHCKPEFYLDLVNVTRLIVETMGKYAKPEWSILELGCGTGRNLAGLYRAGYRRLMGVEINQQAVDLGREHFPEYRDVSVMVAPIEDILGKLPPVDVIFTSGVLMHLPHDLEWVIKLLPEKAKRLIITNEGEREPSFHAWPHDYRALLEVGGWKQVETHSGENYPPLPKTTIKRVFVRVLPEPVVEAKPEVAEEKLIVEPKPAAEKKPVSFPVKPARKAGKKG